MPYLAQNASMSAVLKETMSVEAFLDWESRQACKYEFDGIGPVAMAGVSAAHSTIQTNLIAALRAGLRGGPCRVHGSDLKISAAGSIRYPDAFVVCGPVPPRTLVVPNPVAVFEILSPSTASTDYTEKNREYRDTPSILRYVMLEQDRAAATVFIRDGDDWSGHLLMGDAVLTLPEIAVSLPLAELYEGVTFPERDASAHP